MPAFSGLMLALTALKRLYEGTAGLSILRQSLFPYWHCAGMNNLTSGRSFPFRNGDERAPAAPVLFPRLLWLWPVRNHITFPVIILFFFLL
ncbi:hypothetical protein O5584_23925 [Escherichia coli]|nr:hypothetical protein [Escherichia coli]